MSKRTKTTCNICYESATDLKCNECTFECCRKCIHEWSERSHNCPLCGRFETYDIEYSLLDSEEESIYDYEIYDPRFADPYLYLEEQESEKESEKESEESEKEESEKESENEDPSKN